MKNVLAIATMLTLAAVNLTGCASESIEEEISETDEAPLSGGCSRAFFREMRRNCGGSVQSCSDLDSNGIGSGTCGDGSTVNNFSGGWVKYRDR